MFSPNRTMIDAFIGHITRQFAQAFPNASEPQRRVLGQAARTALETLVNCDCPYHDLQHTMMVADVGQTILQGRQIARGDMSAETWLNAVVAMLLHDIGYLKALLRHDTDDDCVIDADGNTVRPPQGSTDAYMTPYHVSRGVLFALERFEQEDVLDVELIASCIERTRFPVPSDESYQQTDDLPGLVRAADLIGQMADPQYLHKLTRLYAEFVETGEAARLGFKSASDLRESFPDFFYAQVHPYVDAGVAYLKRTEDGQQWLANLYHHLHVNREIDHQKLAPELVVDNRFVVKAQR